MTLIEQDPEFVAVIFAATPGARLFPLTTNATESPKHLLPVAGISLLTRLIMVLHNAGFCRVIVAVSQESRQATWNELKGVEGMREEEHDTTRTSHKPHQPSSTTTTTVVSTSLLRYQQTLHISLQALPQDCAGSAEALRLLADIPSNSHILVLPGDLVVMDSSVLVQLVHAHRMGNLPPGIDEERQPAISTACTMLLANVGEVDEQTKAPLKESQKAKKGGLAREEEDIEYIALCTSSDNKSTPLSPRVIWKQSKIDVEEDEDLMGQTPKLFLPKARLGNKTIVRMDLSDVHAYLLSPWVHRKLVMARMNLISLQGDLLPLLITRQYKDIAATFGSSSAAAPDGGAMRPTNNYASGVNLDSEYAVRAHMVEDGNNKVLRACTIPSYLYACREVVSKAVTYDKKKENPGVSLPPKTTVNTKFNSIVLEGAVLGEKVTCKSSVIGRSSTLAPKCRLNNVVVMDHVTVGENCVLQNSILGRGCKVGENCNLNDCQVTANKVIPAGTKEKGESFS
jgi:translation initiation factor eIF-2B subunit gamma